MQRNFNNMRSSKGYTMMEIAMVIGIIGLSCIILLPRFGRLVHSWDLEIEANKIRAKIRETQQLAITHQRPYRIVWDISGESYSIYKQNLMSGYDLIETMNYKNNVVVYQTTFTAVMDGVEFDIFGAPSQQGMVFMSHTKTGKMKKLIVHSVTGKVDIL